MRDVTRSNTMLSPVYERLFVIRGSCPSVRHDILYVIACPCLV